MTAPYGYMKNPENKYQLVINEEEAKVVRYVFDLYLQGNGLTKIAKILTEEGIPVPGIARHIGETNKTKIYNCWKQTTISRMIKNQVYIGNLEQFKRRKINYKSKIRTTVPLEERVICEGTHEPIISVEKFNRAQEIINKNSSFKGTKHDFLFKGLLFCAECGARLHLTYSHYALQKYGEYRYTTICYTYSKYYNECTRHSNNLSTLEKVLIDNIKKVCKMYIKGDLKDELIKIANEEQLEQDSTKKIEDKIVALNKKLEETSVYIKNLYMDKVKNVVSEETYMELVANFEKEREAYLKEKEELTKLQVKAENNEGNKEMIEKLAKEFSSLKKPTKELLGQLVEKVTISEDNEVTIYFKFKELNEISKRGDNKIGQCKTINKRNKKAS